MYVSEFNEGCSIKLPFPKLTMVIASALGTSFWTDDKRLDEVWHRNTLL